MKNKSAPFYHIKAIGKQGGNDVISWPISPSMSFDKAVEVLDVLRYEAAMQEQKLRAKCEEEIEIDSEKMARGKIETVNFSQNL